MEADFELKGSYYDTDARHTEEVDRAFAQAGDERYTKFVALRGFRIENQASFKDLCEEEPILKVRQDLVEVLFCSSEANSHHVDLLLSHLQIFFEFSSSRYDELTEDEQAFVDELMPLLVLGGGMASVERNASQAVWHSSTFQKILGFDQPSDRELSNGIIKRIETLLFPFFRLHQTTRTKRRPR